MYARPYRGLVIGGGGAIGGRPWILGAPELRMIGVGETGHVGVGRPQSLIRQGGCLVECCSIQSRALQIGNIQIRTLQFGESQIRALQFGVPQIRALQFQ